MNARQRIVISVLLAVAVVGIVFAFQMHEETEEPVRVGTVQQVFPKPGQAMLKQDTIFADLAFPYTGKIVIDEVEIPDTQIKRIQVGDATRLSYTPAPDSATGSLEAGRHHAVVSYWLPERPSEISGYSWDFDIR
jgi:hypothetical protein